MTEALIAGGLYAAVLYMVVAWGYTQLLPMRHAAVFVAVYCAVEVALQLFGGVYIGVVAGLLLMVAVMFALPFALYDAPLLMRAAAVVLAWLCEELGSLAEDAVLGLFLGGEVPEDWALLCQAVLSNPLAAVLAVLAAGMLLVALYSVLGGMLAHFRGAPQPGLGLAAGFLVVQFVLFVEMQVPYSFASLPAAGYMALIAAGAVCVAADVALVAGAVRYERRRLAAERERLLKERLEEELAGYGQLVSEIERACRLRHDLLNQLSAVRYLAESGDMQHAREHLAELRGQIGGAQ